MIAFWNARQAYLTAVFIFTGFCFGLDSKKTSSKDKDEVKKSSVTDNHIDDEEVEVLTMSPPAYAENERDIETENEGQRRKSVAKIVQDYEEKSKKIEENSAQPSIKRRLPEGSLSGRNKFKQTVRS